MPPVTAAALTARSFREAARAQQDATLAGVGAPTPVYRWTTALNGYAVRLTADQARTLAADPAVASVEPDAVRRLAAAPPGRRAASADLPRLGGAGVVVGLVDSGLWPDSPLFADVRGLGRSARDFRGSCATGPGWAADECDDKVVGAHWFVDGFGADRVRSGASLSPLDDDGHGTLMASIAAGNAGVTVKVPGQRAGLYAGTAPQARLAVYKACWTAPDPRDDGCSTADLVTAIDRAVADRVDVLNLSVDGGDGSGLIDTVDRALLGAAEADIVVVGRRRQPRHPGVRRPRRAVGHLRRRHHRHDPARRRGRGRAPAVGRDGRPPSEPTGPAGAGRAGRRRRAPPRRSPATACPAASTRPGCPDASSSASAAGSAGSTSPRPCTAPTASAWCCSTPAAAR